MKKSTKKDPEFNIPYEGETLVDVGKCDNINVDVCNETIVITKSEKTAKDILKAINFLNDLSSELVVQLALACDECTDCYQCFDSNELDDEDFALVPMPVFNAFLDANICLASLYDLIQSDRVIGEVCDEE